jgi:hypothetical protein
MKRLVMLLAVLVAAALSLSATAGASPAPVTGGSNAKACQASGTALVNVHFTMTNDYDSAIDGHAWANDTVSRQLQIWNSTSSGTYCAAVTDQGSFVTRDGTSPRGTGTVLPGITGKIKGGYTTTPFTGTFAPGKYAVSGNLGTFDLGCTTAYDCPGTYPSFLDYFSSTSGADLAVWGWNYHTAQNGTWNNVLTGNSGDITTS